MVLGFGGKHTSSSPSLRDEKDQGGDEAEEKGSGDGGGVSGSTLEKQGQDGETTANNIDPARARINPQVISDSSFIRNSLTYGMPIPTGKTSTWDRHLSTQNQTFHETLIESHADIIVTHVDAHRQASEARAKDYSRPLPTSINNFLVGEHLGTGEGQNTAELGKQRGRDVEEPAHHFSFHTPTVHDRLHGGANMVAGKLRMDQDISTRGKAEFHGQTDDGH